MDLYNDLNIKQYNNLISPIEVLNKIPNNEYILEHIKISRQTIKNILNRLDDRLLIIIGPCSIHDPVAALEYAIQLKKLSNKYKNELFIIMRTYFEKPRTTIGWKGLINDPDLNNTYDINKGLAIARELLLNINNLNLPCGIEFLDTISPQYISDLISWGAIGARTTECQLHRELASGLSVPIGFKNGTDGNIKIAIDAIESSSRSHNFLGINKFGQGTIVQTLGNKDGHIILRGTSSEPNYYYDNILNVTYEMNNRNIQPNIIIDCSHGNSQKNHKNQITVVNYIAELIKTNKYIIRGLMIESNINSGNQILKNKQDLKYGISITDKCIDLYDSDICLGIIANAIKHSRNNI